MTKKTSYQFSLMTTHRIFNTNYQSYQLFAHEINLNIQDLSKFIHSAQTFLKNINPIELFSFQKLTNQQLIQMKTQIHSNIHKVKDLVTDQLIKFREIFNTSVNIQKEINTALQLMVSQYRNNTFLLKNLDDQRTKCIFEIEQIEKQRLSENEYEDLHFYCQHYNIAQPKKHQHHDKQQFLKILKSIQNKLEVQINFEKKELMFFLLKIEQEMKSCGKQLSLFLLKYKETSNNMRKQMQQNVTEKNQNCKYSENLQKRFIQKQIKIDKFDIGNLNEIKKRLRLLQDAHMSESKDCFEYSSMSVENVDVVQESQIIGFNN